MVTYKYEVRVQKDRLENNLNKTNTNKLGILECLFDPPHLGHLKTTLESKKRFKLNKVIWAITKKILSKKKSALNLSSRIALSKKLINKYSLSKYNILKENLNLIEQ